MVDMATDCHRDRCICNVFLPHVTSQDTNQAYSAAGWPRVGLVPPLQEGLVTRGIGSGAFLALMHPLTLRLPYSSNSVSATPPLLFILPTPSLPHPLPPSSPPSLIISLPRPLPPSSPPSLIPSLALSLRHPLPPLPSPSLIPSLPRPLPSC